MGKRLLSIMTTVYIGGPLFWETTIWRYTRTLLVPLIGVISLIVSPQAEIVGS